MKTSLIFSVLLAAALAVAQTGTRERRFDLGRDTAAGPAKFCARVAAESGGAAAPPGPTPVLPVSTQKTP